MSLTPMPGDLVISSRTHSPTVYIVSPFDGPESLVHMTMDAAIQEAFACASHIKVNVWVVETQASFLLLAEYRPLFPQAQ